MSATRTAAIATGYLSDNRLPDSTAVQLPELLGQAGGLSDPYRLSCAAERNVGPEVMSLCLASGALLVKIASTAFTLAWTHSIEKIRWEEEWRVDAGSLVLQEARIRGSGAGMDPPEGARLENGVWHYQVTRRLARLDLAHSPYTAGYTLCLDGHCRPLAEYFGNLPAITTVTLSPCD